MNKQDILTQLELMRNNIEAMSITENYLENLMNGVQVTKKTISVIEKELEYCTNSVKQFKNGFEAVYDDMRQITETDIY